MFSRGVRIQLTGRLSQCCIDATDQAMELQYLMSSLVAAIALVHLGRASLWGHQPNVPAQFAHREKQATPAEAQPSVILGHQFERVP